MNRQIYDNVVQLYCSGFPVKECAKICGISSVKAGRILITEGLWHTQRSDEIFSLLEQGRTKEEIAGKLCISVKAVEAYMPYQRGVYLEGEETMDAAHSRQYRKRIANAKAVAIQSDAERKKEVMNETKPNSTAILHISLKRNYEDPEIDRVLYEYGGVRNGDTLYRDIVIPDTMPLYALHYCILRAFGFLNEHLHCFELPQEISLQLCEDKLRIWKSLSGILFADPDRSDDDRFYLDDYERGSFRAWQKKKYSGPYLKTLPGDSYEECQASAQELLERWPYAAVSRIPEEVRGFSGFPRLLRDADREKYRNDRNYTVMPLSECPLKELLYTFDNDPLTLRESLRVVDLLPSRRVFVTANGILRDGLHGVTDKLIYRYDYGDGWKFEITRFESAEVLTDKHPGKRIQTRTYENAVNTCLKEERPVCIRHEGKFLVEDVGGLYGYIQFLRSLHPEEEYHEFMNHMVDYEDNGPYDSRETSIIWAESLDWSDKEVVDRTLL